jgi:hypothetical protein
LAIKVTADKSTVERKLANTSASWLFHIGVGISDWKEPLDSVFRRWLEWFAALDLTRGRHPIITVMTVEYPAQFLPRLLCQRALTRARRDIRRMAGGAELGVAVHALPELHRVRFDDVEQWIREYAENVDPEVLRRRVRRHFSRALGFGERRLSMYDVAEIVKAALSDASVRIGVS